MDEDEVKFNESEGAEKPKFTDDAMSSLDETFSGLISEICSLSDFKVCYTCSECKSLHANRYKLFYTTSSKYYDD